jgi:hypothetical protein
MLIDVIDSIDQELVKESYLKIEKGITWIEYPNGKQTGLQYHPGSDPWEDAVGRMKPGQTWTDTEINPYFKGTYFEEIITKYKLLRTRLLWLKPYSCYSMHRDDSTRIHVPIITNDRCFFVFRNSGLFNMPTGQVYHVNTLDEHSAMNCSTEWRLHLLGAVVD